MKIHESEKSLRSKFALVVKNHCPELVVYDDYSTYDLTFRTSYFKDFDMKFRIFAGGRDAPEHSWEHRVLFEKGEWQEINLEVLDKKYFDKALRIAEEYERIAAKSVYIVKNF